MLQREGRERQEVVAGVDEHGYHVAELAREGDDDAVELLGHSSRVGLGEDRAYGGGNHLGVGARDPGQHVAHEMHPAALPGRADHHRGDSLLEPEVVIGDHQAHAAEASGAQRA